MSTAAPAEAAPALRLDGLTRRFGDARRGPVVTALDALTLDIAEGELFGLVGPDGAGKTTTLRMLAGVLRPSEGDARVAGHWVGKDPEAVKPHIAYMAQRFGLYEDLTVAENLEFYADLYRVPRWRRRERFERLFRFSRLGDFRGRLAGALSGGMKQKLGLSCCLVHQPRVLLLDEPTFGVDPISRRELWLILEEMVAEGTTVVVSTSYMDEAERCDRVAMLHEGSLLALDSPAALRASLPGTMMALRVDGGAGAEVGGDARAEVGRDAPAQAAANTARQLRSTLRATPGVTGAALFGETVHALLAPDTAWADIEPHLAAAGGPALDARPVTPSLEDIFIHRVQGDG